MSLFLENLVYQLHSCLPIIFLKFRWQLSKKHRAICIGLANVFQHILLVSRPPHAPMDGQRSVQLQRTLLQRANRNASCHIANSGETKLAHIKGQTSLHIQRQHQSSERVGHGDHKGGTKSLGHHHSVESAPATQAPNLFQSHCRRQMAKSLKIAKSIAKQQRRRRRRRRRRREGK